MSSRLGSASFAVPGVVQAVASEAVANEATAPKLLEQIQQLYRKLEGLNADEPIGEKDLLDAIGRRACALQEELITTKSAIFKLATAVSNVAVDKLESQNFSDDLKRLHEACRDLQQKYYKEVEIKSIQAGEIARLHHQRN